MLKDCPVVPKLAVGEAVTHRGLCLYPLFGGTIAVPGYATLDEALAAGAVRVTELSASGSVPELRLVNAGCQAALLLDGEELVGAKQNRVLNLTILAPAHQEIVIPVSCVESGRWSMRSEAFASSPRAHHATGRAMKMDSVSRSMAFTGQRHSDQGAVWQDIEEKSRRMAAPSPTQAMADIFEQNRRSIDEYVEAMPASEGQVGAIFAINGRVIGLDAFDCPATLAKLLPKLVVSYALDAIDAGEAPFEPSTAADAEALLRDACAARAETFPSVGEGADVRLHGPALTGAALVARGRTVHLSAFRWNGPETEQPSAHRSRLARPSHRGRRPAE